MTSIMARPHFFDDFLRDFPAHFSIRPLHGEPLPSPDKIKVDVKESGNDVIVSAEIPGVDKEDIHVEVEKGIVTIGAVVKQSETSTDDEKVLHSERYFGSIERSFALPCAVDDTKAKAAYKNGVLTLTVPKTDANGKNKIVID